MTRTRAFWIAYAAVSIACAVIAARLFPLAIPIVNLDIKLSRHDAVDKAKTIAAAQRIAEPDARTAVRFAHDQAAQNYVELEGGGKPAFAALVAGGVYAPYWWEVRLFRPGEIGETEIRLTPDGAPWGFEQKIPEAQVPSAPAGLALSSADARALAEARARRAWGVDFTAYRPLQHTELKRTTGRVDHAFTYERTGGHPGDARLRLRLTVAGDALTEVTHYVHVPEAFERRYGELRSANNALAGAAGIAAGVLYGVGGCVIGALWLLRRHFLLWRPALAAGIVVGTLLGAALLASAPSAWFDYDTAQATSTFWIRIVARALMSAVVFGLGFALVFMAAEGLSRRAFPSHPQLWRLWSRDAAPTREVLGRTLGGYLFVPVALAFVAAFYYATNRWLGWWQPSEALTDPNVLGSVVPALSPIALSLQAGFMEESLFRAVPLSIAALIGAHFGRRTLAIAIAVVIQALVFAAAHANYPGFPYYSRLVELVLPATMWALIFLRFGLLPTVLLHALFDLLLFSIPIFLVDAPEARLQQALVVAAALLPIAIVVARRVRAPAWGALDPSLRNQGWRAAEAAHVETPAEELAQRDEPRWVARFQRALPWLGAGGFVLWLVATPFRADVPGIQIDRAQAEAAADAALRARGVVLGPEWKRYAVVRAARDDPVQWTQHRFVWSESGAETYRRVVGGALAPPLWEVRYARFDGDVVERAEEWRVTVNGDGTLRQARHALPEQRAGARLSRDDAHALAVRAAASAFHREPGAFDDVGADERRRPARTDWSFTFADREVPLGGGGEARFVVTIAGDEVVGAGRYVHVPETWLRAERERLGRFTLLRYAIFGAVLAATIAALIFAVVAWARGRSDRRTLVGLAGATFVLSLIGSLNAWPQAAMDLATTEPLTTQIALAALRRVAAALVGALLIGVVGAVALHAAARRTARAVGAALPAWIAGIAAALFAEGVAAALERLAPRLAPLWPDLGMLSAGSPAIDALLVGARSIVAIAAALFVLVILERVTDGWRRRQWIVALTLVALLIANGITAPEPVAAIARGVAAGLAVVAVVLGVLRYDAAAVPAFMATAGTLAFVEQAVRGAWPGATLHALAVALAAGAAAWIATRFVESARRSAPAALPD
jgi:hypothetical protein